MIKVVSVEEMRAIEAAADIAGVSYAQMMETAGRATADRVKWLLREIEGARVVVLVGPGNNGGDGLVAGRLVAAETNTNVAFYLARKRDPEKDENFRKVRDAGLRIIDEPDYAGLRTLIAGADVIVDALLGTGATLPVRGELKTIMEHTRAALEGRRLQAKANQRYQTPAQPGTLDFVERSGPIMLAVDVPSGMDADTGALDDCTLYANETITFEAAKCGHFLFPGADAVGVLHVAPLNLPESLPELRKVRLELAHPALIHSLLPQRPSDSNKGTYGKALILGGSQNYIGAPGLSASAAYRVGAGLVTVAAPDTIVPILAAQYPEVTWLPLPDGHAPDNKTITDAGASLAYTQMPDYSAMLIGPGLGRALNVHALIDTLLNYGEGQIPPLVIDADGLNMLATMDEWWPRLPRRTILTPHPGEMARLAGITGHKGENWRSPAEMVQMERLRLASEKAAEWGCVVVLKGAFTIVADPDGRRTIIPFAEPALARAGTGDVLAGMIVGYLAQGMDPFAAAVVAAYLHGYAGRMARQFVGTPSSVLASDVIAALPMVIAEIEAVD